MVKMQKALVCVDLSDYSKMTMDYALSLARGFKMELAVISVINKREVEAVETASHYYPEQINIEHFLKEAKADRRKRIDEMIKEHFSSDTAEIKTLIRVGIPFVEILKAVKEENCDLVILGNKGKTNILGTLFGSNAEKVFRHSPVPILSVRDREKFSRQKD